MPRLMFQRPRRIEWEDLTASFGRMTAEPFEKGYALTVGGSSLRRVLLSAIPAPPWCGPRWRRCRRRAGPGRRGGPRDHPAQPEEDGGAAQRQRRHRARGSRCGGRGRRPAPTSPGTGSRSSRRISTSPRWRRAASSRSRSASAPAGVRLGGPARGRRPAGAIGLDAAFSPIRRVNYQVEMSRLGNITDYEKLVVEITTDGSIRRTTPSSRRRSSCATTSTCSRRRGRRRRTTSRRRPPPPRRPRGTHETQARRLPAGPADGPPVGPVPEPPDGASSRTSGSRPPSPRPRRSGRWRTTWSRSPSRTPARAPAGPGPGAGRGGRPPALRHDRGPLRRPPGRVHPDPPDGDAARGRRAGGDPELVDRPACPRRSRRRARSPPSRRAKRRRRRGGAAAAGRG